MSTPQVVVIGGGITGVGVARDLAMRGVAVTVCDRGSLGGGTTGHSHGVLHSGARYAVADPATASECIAENQILRDIAGACITETGGLFVQLDDDPARACAARLAACQEAGIPTTTYSPQTVQELEPALTTDIEQAFRVPDAVVYPSRLVAATAESARRHGATIRTHEAVLDIDVQDGPVAGVVTEAGRIPADHVVNAAGAWAGQIAALADISFQMAPTRGVMVAVTGPVVERVLNRCRPPTDGDIIVPHDDQIIIGTTSEPVTDPDTGHLAETEIDHLLAAGGQLVPDVKTGTVRNVYWGVRPLAAPSALADQTDQTTNRPAARDARDTKGEVGRSATRGFQVFDHAAADVAGLTTVTGGKVTTYRLMAEAVSDVVCDALAVSASCQTATASLPGEDPADVDALVQQYHMRHPADTDVIDPA